MPPWRLSEISKYVTVGVSGLFNPCGAIMNKESYAALTPTQKAAFDKLTGKALALSAAKIFDDWAEQAFKQAQDSKRVEVIQLSPEVRKAMFDAAKPVVDKTHRRYREGRHRGCARGLRGDEQVTAQRRLTSLLRAHRPVVHAVALYCGGAVLAALMTTIIIDVIGRYVFNSPLYGSLDLAVVLLVLAVSCAIGYGGRAGAHVTADMVTTLVGPKFEWISGVCIKMFAAGITAIWSWRLFVTGRPRRGSARARSCSTSRSSRSTRRSPSASGSMRWCWSSRPSCSRSRGEVPLLIDESRGRGKPGMSNTAIGLAGLGGLFALFILRMPVGLSMLIAGLLGTVAIRGWTQALPSLSSETFAIASFYQLSVIPMFVLMGNVAGASGMGRDLYNAAYAWVGHIRGGLASATIIACACFASLCGSAAASAVTMGRVALPGDAPLQL